jgi:6-pyruvoyltetrahydropterin/6-carboxytetrahydropterin synthase
MIQVTRKIEFDAGHRIPDHKSKCRNMHGHRYVLEATISGPLQKTGSDKGMVADFGDLKELMTRCIGEPWDHAFLVYADDVECREALIVMGPAHKTVVLGIVPTVENLAALAFKILRIELEAAYPNQVVLQMVRLYETPNCWADATR